MKKLSLKWITILALAALTSIASVAYAAPLDAAKNPCTEEERYPQITTAELKQVAEQKSAFIVDVNSDASFKKAHVPGAVHFGKGEGFAQALPKDKNTLIVAYCGGPRCTAWKKAAEVACAQGYTNVRHFKDGISGWVKSSAN